MDINSGALGSKPSAHRETSTGRAPVFLCVKDMNDLIAKAAIDRRITEIIAPVIEDMGLSLIHI